MLKYTYLISGLILFLGSHRTLHCQTIFPDIENWEKSDTIMKYDSENLWNCINGAADYYLGYNFEELEVCEYSRAGNEYIKAEVYNHQNALNAFGIYAYERPPETRYLTIGSEGYFEPSALNFYCNKYYVKVHSHLNDEEAIASIGKIAGLLADHLCKKSITNLILDKLPAANRIPHSEKYYPANFLGYSFLNSAIEAGYKINNEEYKLFIIEQENPEKAREMLTAYLDFTRSDAKVENSTIYQLDDMFNGRVTILIRDNLLYGVYNTKNESLAIETLKEISAR